MNSDLNLKVQGRTIIKIYLIFRTFFSDFNVVNMSVLHIEVKATHFNGYFVCIIFILLALLSLVSV